MNIEVKLVYIADRLLDSIESFGIETEEEWDRWMEARSESFEAQIESEIKEMEMDD